MMAKAVAILCAISVLQLAGAARVAYLDGDSFINADLSDGLTPNGVSGVLLGLLNSPFPQASSEISQQVEKVLSGNVFRRPAAVVALQVIGAGDALTETGIGTTTPRHLDVNADASSILQAVAAVAEGDARSFHYQTLDHVGLPSTCGETCQEIMVYDAVLALGYNYTARKQPSIDCGPGPWCYWVTSGEDKLLDMGFMADRLFALELGLLRYKALEAASARKAAARESGPPKLLEATLLGLQALASKYGTDSRQYRTAVGMLRGTIAEVWQALRQAYGGNVVMQLTSTEPPASGSSLNDLLQWRTVHRQPFQRRLLQQDGDYVTAEFGAVSVQWATSSAAWLISIVILVSIIAASICLCQMKFEQDTLLYARPKAE